MENKEIKGKIVYLPVEKLHPHEDNPRENVGDVTELTESIKANGILQNLTVVPATGYYHGDYTVIIGHRRLAAAKLAGLTEVPCVVVEMAPKEQVSTMLTENMQRTDLTLCEEAQGFQMMIDFGDSVKEVAATSGFSETKIRKRLKLAKLDRDKFREAEPRGGTIEDYIAIAEIADEKKRNKLMETIGTNNFDWELRRAQREQTLKEKMPFIKNEMKVIKAKRDDKINLWDSEYKIIAEIQVSEFSEGCISEKLKTNKEYFWNIYNDSEVRVYKKAPKTKTKKPKKSAKELHADEKRKKLAELTDSAYERRKAFVSEFVVTKATEAAVQAWIWELAYKRLDNSYYGSLGIELMCEKTGEKREAYKYRFERENIDKFVNSSPKNAPVVILHAMSGDDRKLSYYSKGSGEISPTYLKSTTLDFIYERLCSIGYEMSDEEKALQDGTHELFAVGEIENEAE